LLENHNEAQLDVRAIATTNDDALVDEGLRADLRYFPSTFHLHVPPLRECIPDMANAAAILRDKKAEATTVRGLRAWIDREIHLDLSNAPFDPQDETILPMAGACARCPKRTGSNPLLFPEVQKSI
jgi:transcriptional regulator with GAF, ATPase, and Fis domain